MATISTPVTIADIVQEGLELGGDTSLIDRATPYLVLLLAKLARDYDWPELLKTQSITALKETARIDISGISDYKATRKVRFDEITAPLLESKGGYPDLIHTVEEAEREGNYGTPREYVIEPDKTDLILYPIPEKQYSGHLLYYSIPATPTDDTEEPWFEDTAALVMAVAEFAKLHQQESLVQLVQAQVDTMVARTRMAARDRGRDRPVTMRRDPNSFPEVQIDRG